MPVVKPLKMSDIEDGDRLNRNRYRMSNRMEAPEELVLVTETVPSPASVSVTVSFSMMYPMTPPSTIPDGQNDEDENNQEPSNKLSDEQIIKQLSLLPDWLRVKSKQF